MAKGFTKVYYVEHLGDSPTPARVNRITGELYINMSRWREIEKEEHRVFIVLHELAHVILNSSDEQEVDQLAFVMYTRLGYSLKESVRALSAVLSGNSPAHYWRVYLQLERAKMYDYTMNKNEKVYDQTYKATFNKEDKTMCQSNCSNCTGCSALYTPSVLSSISSAYEDFYTDYTGCIPGEKPRQCRKRIRVEGNAVKKENRTEAMKTKAQAKQTLADQGISEKAIRRQNAQDTIANVGRGVQGIFGKGGSGDGGDGSAAKWLPWVIGGIGAIGLLGLLGYIMKLSRATK